MAKGMSNSDVSDADSCPSLHEFADLVRTEKAKTKLISKNKDHIEKLTSSSSKYKELADKFDMIIDQNDELTKQIQIIEQTKATPKKASNTFLKLKRTSTSCIDLIDKYSPPSYNEIFVENVFVSHCQENEELKQEVESLPKDWTRLKGKSCCHECKKQPPQDNCRREQP